MERVYIGLGSNLANPVEQIYEAIIALMDLPQSQWVAVSSLYVSKPHGPQNQPDFVNAVAAIDTDLSPEQLLVHCQELEDKQGRLRTRRWGERTIDLDILLYGNQMINTDKLVVPHPHMHERSFVMVPLLEVLLPTADLTAQPDVVKDYLAKNPELIAGHEKNSDLSR